MFANIDALELMIIAALAYAAYEANTQAARIQDATARQKAKTASIILFIAAGYMLMAGVKAVANPGIDPFDAHGTPGLTSLSVMELLVVGAIGYAAYTLYTVGLKTPAFIAGGAGAYLLYEAYQSDGASDEF